MKRHVIISTIILSLFTSCMKSPQIYRTLSEEERAIVPYQIGQVIRLLDQNGDTLKLKVTADNDNLVGQQTFWGFGFHAFNKLNPDWPPYCYIRIVDLNAEGYETNSTYANYIMRFVIAPEKQLAYYGLSGKFYCDLRNTPTETLTLNGITYQDVYHIEQTQDSVSVNWFLKEEYGLLALKNGDKSLTLLP